MTPTSGGDDTAAGSVARRVLLLTHTGRAEAHEVARAFCKALTGHGLVVRLLAAEAAELGLDTAHFDPALEIVDDEGDAGHDCELALVIGGDGTILRAAEITHSSGTPLLGVNLGHVGFLAEAEYDDVESTIDAIVQRRYTAEDRLTVDVSVRRDGELVTSTFALNEASVEKAARERMIELVVEIDGRPLSRWGCDGVVCATPTGSTAYNLSARGPIMSPLLRAIVVTPVSPHSLFAHSFVLGPDESLEVEVLDGRPAALVLDGRDLGPLAGGDTVACRAADHDARFVTFGERDFHQILKAKFGLGR